MTIQDTYFDHQIVSLSSHQKKTLRYNNSDYKLCINVFLCLQALDFLVDRMIEEAYEDGDLSGVVIPTAASGSYQQELQEQATSQQTQKQPMRTPVCTVNNCKTTCMSI